MPPLLAIFGAVLDLGFTGKFALAGHEARAALMRAITDRVGRDQDTSGPVLVRPAVVRRWNGHLSPLTGVVAIASVAAALIYVGLHQWLAASIAQIAQ